MVHAWLASVSISQGLQGSTMTIYRQFGLEPILNAAGTLTRLGGAPMPDAVVEAMRQAAQHAVPIEELQAAASRILARLAGTQAGLVTAGASAGLTLGSAAILARNNLVDIESLPHLSSGRNQFLIARDQRNGYDHAVRAAGGQLIDVGLNDVVAGSGVRPVELWEFEAARNEQTAGVVYVDRRGAAPPLADVVRWAHEHHLAVLVDAAAELPPASNLRSIPATGADLVVFSGGKAIRGPQNTGLLVGQRELIESAALQMLDMDERIDLWDPPADFIDRRRWPNLPRQGIGRGFKVAKEQLVGLVVALELFVNQDPAEQMGQLRDRCARLVDELRSQFAGVTLSESPDASGVFVLIPHPDPLSLARSLRQQSPPIYVRITPAGITLDLTCIRDQQVPQLRDGLLRGNNDYINLKT
jgi:L-seryl-tRNA(Ser) seleniumtransferase